MARMLWTLILVCLFTTAVRADVSSGTEDGSEEWGYIDSRPGIILQLANHFEIVAMPNETSSPTFDEAVLPIPTHANVSHEAHLSSN